MGLTIDRETATERFGRALVLARSEEALPEDWLDRARRVGQAKNKTFTPMLGTALLARAADEQLDVRSLREDESDRGYSARSLAKEVLVPCCVRAGIDLRVRGAEPLNNQPFLRAPRVSTALKVTKPAVPDLAYLCECLDAVEALRGRPVLDALAAFLRVRIEASEPPTPVTIGSGVLTLADLLAVADDMARRDDPGVCVAVVAAGLSLVFKDVRSRKPRDPTSTWPGDIGVFSDQTQTLAFDVSNRSSTEADVLLFAGRLADAEIRRGTVLALGAESRSFDAGQVQFQARRLHGVELSFYTTASNLLREAIMFSVDDLTLSLAAYPRLVLRRMHDLGVAVGQMEAWAAHFAVSPRADEGP